jgi:cytochrome P450
VCRAADAAQAEPWPSEPPPASVNERTYHTRQQTPATGLGVTLLGVLQQDRGVRAEIASCGPRGFVAVVEEALRWESPAQLILRTANARVTVDGATVAAGDRLALALGAANRDPDVFQSPHTFEWRRRHNRHLAFGIGARRCLGAPLARAQARVACSGFLRRYPRAEPQLERITWKPDTAFRGLRTVRVSLG